MIKHKTAVKPDTSLFDNFLALTGFVIVAAIAFGTFFGSTAWWIGLIE